MKVKPFEVIPMSQWVIDNPSGKGKGTIFNHPVAGAREISKGWNLRWPDGTKGLPGGYGITVDEYKSKEFVKAIGVIAAHRGFKGFGGAQ